MAPKWDHNRDAISKAEAEFGRGLTEEEKKTVDLINTRIDQFAHYPDMRFLEKHRKFLHHREGVEYFSMLYGDLGRITAEAHIMLDCGRIPEATDYYDGVVNEYGQR